MMKKLVLLALYAHPDDEVLGLGGALARYAAAGVYTALVCTTRGEAGEISDAVLATPETLGVVREGELRCSAQTLGLGEVIFLGYRDSGMVETAENQHPNAFINAPAEQVIPQLVQIIRRLQPHVLLTFEPYGGYGHPDHIAINRHTLAAIPLAADPAYRPDLGAPWHISRLFYPILRRSFFVQMKELMGQHGMDTAPLDNILQRREQVWPDELYHCELDVAGHVEQKWAAFRCHRTQFGGDNLFNRLPEVAMKQLLSREYFALAYPETAEITLFADLFAGL